MQILEPIVHETVWGGTKLASFVETDCRKIGHLYGVIDTKKMCGMRVRKMDLIDRPC